MFHVKQRTALLTYVSRETLSRYGTISCPPGTRTGPSPASAGTRRERLSPVFQIAVRAYREGASRSDATPLPLASRSSATAAIASSFSPISGSISSSGT